MSSCTPDREEALSLCRAISVVLLFLVAASTSTGADETHARYFEELRRRGLFGLAESEAVSRLADEDLPLTARTSFSIELSRTLMEHAGFAADDQRNELWQRARATIQDLLNRDASNPRRVALQCQLAAVYAAEGDWLRAERELRPYDEPLLNQTRIACTKAIELSKAVEKQLSEPPQEAGTKKASNALPGSEVRLLLHQVRWQLGQSYRNRAELAAAGSTERTADFVEADLFLRKLTGPADEPLQTRAKLMLATCHRLKNELGRAAEILTNLEKTDLKAGDAVQNEIVAERVRLMIAMRRPTEAAELLLKTRGQRQRLTGDLWLLQVQVLIGMRQVALDKQQDILANRLSEQIATAIDRCQEQVGGFWTRRCRQLWENTQTSDKYGPELDGLMQQARRDFTAGRIDTALAVYAAAEQVAVQQGQAVLAMELGFTRASILLDEKKFEAATTEFFRLVSKYETDEKTPQAHLLATYCLGRLYDEKKTQPRREAYTEALDRHINEFSKNKTVNDAYFLKAQLEEQRLQATQALPLYLQVDSRHARALDAVDGAARCYETILRRMTEKRLPTAELEQQAIEQLTRFLQATGTAKDTWTVTHADIAIRLSGILLNSPVSSRITDADRWLDQIESFVERKDLKPADTEMVSNLRQRMSLLRIVTLAGKGTIAEAQSLLKSQSASPAELLVILEKLTQMVDASGGKAQSQLASLQLEASERLASERSQLSPAQAEQFDRCYLKACLSSGKQPKAIETGRHLIDAGAKDADRLRELARLFSESNNKEIVGLAKQSWRRVEGLTKAGSPEWMQARLSVLQCCVRSGELDEGRKLLQVTKALYPDFGSGTLKDDVAAVERELKSSNK